MAGTYSTDLTTHGTAESGETWTEPSNNQFNDIRQNRTVIGDTDDFIQGTACVSSQPNINRGSLMSDGSANMASPPNFSFLPNQQTHFLVWMKYDSPATIIANEGIKTVYASAAGSITTFDQFGGDDYPLGNWKCIASGLTQDLANINFTNPTISPADTTSGGHANNYRYVGWMYDVNTAPARGNGYKVDAIRYGRCTLTAVGGTDTAVTNSSNSTAANFIQMAEYNDYNAGGTPANGAAVDGGRHRFGLFQALGQPEGSYLYKGRMQIGTSASSCYFDAVNANIVIDDTRVVTNGFNRIEINNDATTVNWTGININSGAVRSPGIFAVSNNPTVTVDSSTFTNMATFSLSESCKFTSTTWRNCYNITSNGAEFDNCTFSQQTALSNSNPVALTLTNASGNPDASQLARIQNCTFTSPGQGYAIDLGTISSNVAVSVDLSNVKFNGYLAGTLGDNTGEIAPGSPNIAILVTYNGTADLTINVVDGSDTPSLLNDGSGTVTIAAPPRNFELTGLKDRTEVRLVNSSTNTEIAGVENVIGGVGTGINNGDGAVTVSGTTDENTFNYAYQYSADTNIFAAILSSSTYEVIYLNSTLEDSDKSIPIQQQIDRNSNL